MTRAVAALVPDDLEWLAIRQSAPQHIRLIPCRSVEALRGVIRATPHAVLYSPGMGLLETPTVVDELTSAGVNLVVHFVPTRRAVTELVALAECTLGIRTSLRSPTGTRAAELFSVLDEPDGGPVATVLSRCSRWVSSEATRFIAVALVLGRSHSCLDAFASTCGVAPRTIQTYLRTLGLPGPHRLMCWGRAFWALWRLQHWGLNCKQAAISGGFTGVTAMTLSLMPMIGSRSIAALLLGESVPSLLERLQQDLQRIGSSASDPLESATPIHPSAL
jgi:hypothetical protein